MKYQRGEVVYTLIIWSAALNITTLQLVPLPIIEIPGYHDIPATATRSFKDALTNCLSAVDSHNGAMTAAPRANEKHDTVRFITLARCERLETP